MRQNSLNHHVKKYTHASTHSYTWQNKFILCHKGYQHTHIHTYRLSAVETPSGPYFTVMHACTCMCVYVYVYTNTHTSGLWITVMYACMCICACVYIHTYIRALDHSYACMYMYMHICIHTYRLSEVEMPSIL